uniref:site-2 protease family protein n=1 Tax=Ruminococcus sp. TaxID=41978 RepID=UPI0038686C3C
VGKEHADTIPKIEEKESRKRFRTNMTVERDGEKLDLQDVDLLTLKKSADDDTPQLQIDFYIKPIEKNFGTVIQQTFANTVSVVRMVWGSLIGLIKGQFSLNDMSGPVGIASAITKVAGESLRTSGFGSAVSSIVYVMMVITINLGVVNMLPFPALDGGRFLMLLIEWIFRKPVPRKVENIINTVGLVLLLGLSVVIAFKDVWKIFSGG